MTFCLSISLLNVNTDDTVYICKGQSSKKYHLVKNCRGLSNCSTDISEIKKSNAKEMGQGLCGWED